MRKDAGLWSGSSEPSATEHACRGLTRTKHTSSPTDDQIAGQINLGLSAPELFRSK